MGLNYAVSELNSIVKKSIQDALLELLETKHIREISITALCEKAGVSRASFYRNYEDKTAILRDYLIKCTEEYFMVAPKNDIREYYISFFSYLKSMAPVAKLLYENGLYGLIYEVFVCESEKAEVFAGRDSYIKEYMTGGTFFVMNKWFYDKMDKTPEEIADILCDFVSGYPMFNKKSEDNDD